MTQWRDTSATWVLTRIRLSHEICIYVFLNCLLHLFSKSSELVNCKESKTDEIADRSKKDPPRFIKIPSNRDWNDVVSIFLFLELCVATDRKMQADEKCVKGTRGGSTRRQEAKEECDSSESKNARDVFSKGLEFYK